MNISIWPGSRHNNQPYVNTGYHSLSSSSSSFCCLYKFLLNSPGQYSGKYLGWRILCSFLEFFWASLKSIFSTGPFNSQLPPFEPEGLLDFDFISLPWWALKTSASIPLMPVCQGGLPFAPPPCGLFKRETMKFNPWYLFMARRELLAGPLFKKNQKNLPQPQLMAHKMYKLGLIDAM